MDEPSLFQHSRLKKGKKSLMDNKDAEMDALRII
jgi:hypothetical protein